MMEYKGYVGIVDYDAEAKLFHGDIVNTRDVITFQGTSVKEIEKAFRDSVEDYLAWCREENMEPERPYSGKFSLRLPPELHKEVAMKARKLKMSINSFVEKAIHDEIAALR
ncbi:MAG: type II toxin-antitoxin system HicB family antitoxin [Treponema sp.]|jgi:predicted HicB family RNase H-like nuclease|nr:type II toxin-antitoxin system HicB family antitoxin [Treponema sp.]